MDYNQIKITPLNLIPDDSQLTIFIAQLLAKTGFYAQSQMFKQPDNFPFTAIAEKFITPYKNITSVIYYDNEPIGFYQAHLINQLPYCNEATLTPSDKITWQNLGESIYERYKVYFKNQEFLIDNIAITEKFQQQGILSSIIFPRQN